MGLNLLDKLRRTARLEHDAETTSFKRLVQRVAAGDIDEAAVRENLVLLGRTVEELDQAVERHRERAGLISQLADAGVVAGRLAAIELRLKALGEEMQAARKAAEVEVRSLKTESAQLTSRMCQLEAIRTKLRQSFTDPEAKAREAALCEQKHVLLAEQRRLRKVLSGNDGAMIGVSEGDSARIQSARRELSELQRQRKSMKAGRQRDKHDELIAASQAAGERMVEAVRPIWDSLRSVANKMSVIDEELASIAREKVSVP